MKKPCLYNYQISLYLVCAVFILAWWMLAFYRQLPLFSFQSPLPLPIQSFPPSMITIERSVLQQALLGDFNCMLQCILDWDQNATALEQMGLPGMKKLTSDQLLQAQCLHHLIRHSTPQALQHLNQQISAPYASSNHPLLPQTHMAATFLLGIADPKALLAIPRGLRDLPNLYPSHLLKQTPNDSHTYTGEKLFQASPRLVFISPYSHPPTLEALRQQNIPCFVLPSPNQIDDIFQSLTQIGNASGHSLEASLLHLFMRAAFFTIDNRLKALHAKMPIDSPQTVLYLYNGRHYTLPTLKSLAGQLLQRALECDPSFISPWLHSLQQWQIPFTRENIQQANPDCLLIALSNGHDSLYQLDTSPFYDLAAFERHKIFLLDKDIQESPTQYIVLAYFDLFQALVTAHFYE